MYDGISTYCTDDIVFTATNPKTSTPLWNENVYVNYYNIAYVIDTATGINEFGTIESASEQLYTLQGTRVKTPVKGQVYVKNGKKVIF